MRGRDRQTEVSFVFLLPVPTAVEEYARSKPGTDDLVQISYVNSRDPLNYTIAFYLWGLC